MAEPNFPTGVVDGTTYIYGDKICVYHQESNTWECQTNFGGPITSNEDSSIYTTDVLIPQGLRDAVTAVRQEEVPVSEPSQEIRTQYDANQALLALSQIGAKNVGRAYDLVDFTQNTGTQGYWIHTEDEGGGDVPQEAEFFAFDEDGNQTQQFADVRQFKFNDSGVVGNPGTENKLESARPGDTLIVQETIENHFGMYIVTDITTENAGGVIYRTLGVKVYRGARAFGDVQYMAHCSVRVMRPEVVIVQDEQPVVSTRGVLWYREEDDHLFISNYADGFSGGIGPQWTDLTAGGGGAGVHVGELPPDEEEGALWFDTTRLELYIYYVEGEDGGWLPSSPLGARVSAGEALQQQILGRVDGHDSALNDLYSNQADFLRNQTSNDVTTAFRIKSGGKTLISTSGNVLSLYNLHEPTNPTHAATAGYVDKHIGPTWKWIVDGSSLASQRQAIRWYTSDNITMNLYVHGLTLTGPEYDFNSGPRSNGDDPRELMSIYGLNPEGKMKHILIAPVRNWEFGGGFCAFRCNVADMRIWDPTGLENETPVYFRFGALF